MSLHARVGSLGARGARGAEAGGRVWAAGQPGEQMGGGLWLLAGACVVCDGIRVFCLYAGNTVKAGTRVLVGMCVCVGGGRGPCMLNKTRGRSQEQWYRCHVVVTDLREVQQPAPAAAAGGGRVRMAWPPAVFIKICPRHAVGCPLPSTGVPAVERHHQLDASLAAWPPASPLPEWRDCLAAAAL